jgi:hypothetical protein
VKQTQIKVAASRIPVGTVVTDSQTGYRFVRVQAGAAIAQFDAVRIVAGLADVRPTSAVNQAYLGVAQEAIASGAKGWIQIDGKMTCKVVAATAVGSPLVTNGTAGTLALADATGFARPGKAIASAVGAAAGSEIVIT